MNAIFTIIVLISACIMFVISPAQFLPAMLSGTEKAVKTALVLFCIYAVWMSIAALSEKSGANGKMSKLLKPLCKKVFKTNSDKGAENLAMNISCNLLGLGGAATPYAVQAIKELNRTGNDYGQKLLFVLNATSVQVIPTTVLALRAQAGSNSAADIILPCFISSLCCTVAAVVIYVLWEKIWKE